MLDTEDVWHTDQDNIIDNQYISLDTVFLFIINEWQNY